MHWRCRYRGILLQREKYYLQTCEGDLEKTIKLIFLPLHIQLDNSKLLSMNT